MGAADGEAGYVLVSHGVTVRLTLPAYPGLEVEYHQETLFHGFGCHVFLRYLGNTTIPTLRNLIPIIDKHISNKDDTISKVDNSISRITNKSSSKTNPISI